MARLQDFQTVTPTSSDKLLVVQSQGQGLVPYGSKLDSSNPTGTGKLSLNRKSGTTEGANSVATGQNCTASGTYSFATGDNTTASGNRAFTSGASNTASGERSFAANSNNTASGDYSFVTGYNNQASGNISNANGNSTIASGAQSTTHGTGTKASRRSQVVFGEYNVEDTGGSVSTDRGTYVEIVGKGTSTTPSNARTLDWSGNEVLAGGLKINGNQDVATLLNLSSEYKGAATSADLMAWFVTKCSTMADGGVAIVTINPNYSSDGFLGGSGIQPAIIFRSSSTVFRVAFPCICGQAYYYSNAWHYTKATMSAVTPT